jgi:hypothetical protein
VAPADDGFPGERPEHHMRKLAASNARVTCGSCRQFDGTAWCRRWNFHTEPSAPVCGQYRPLAVIPPPRGA